MSSPTQQPTGRHLQCRLQPFHLHSFHRNLTFLPHDSPVVQPYPFPSKREVRSLLITDYLFHDWDVKFACIGHTTQFNETSLSLQAATNFYKSLVVDHDYFINADRLDHAYFKLISEVKYATLTYYAHFDAFLLKLVAYNNSEYVGEANYEYYLTILRMLLSVSDRLSDLMTIGFKILLDPDIHVQYYEAIYKACGVSQVLQDEVREIMWGLLIKGLVMRKDIPEMDREPEARGKYKVLKSKPVVDEGLKFAGVSPRDDPFVCDANVKRAKTGKMRLGKRIPSPARVEAGNVRQATLRPKIAKRDTN